MHNLLTQRVAGSKVLLMTDLLTSAETCERLGIDRSTLSRWVAAGAIVPAHKLPGTRGAFLFESADVARLVKAAS